MEIAKLVLEYIRVLLSWPVVVLALGLFFLVKFKEPITALIGRIAAIKLPGGGELLLPQTIHNELVAQAKVEATMTATLGPTTAEATGQVSGAPDDGAAQRLRSERERAALWEYRFLNYFLVPRTHVVLDWLANRQPTSYGTYDAWIMRYVPNPLERQAMINALRNHHLIHVNGDMISVTEKGHEYIEWRGPARRFLADTLPPVEPPSSTLPPVPPPEPTDTDD